MPLCSLSQLAAAYISATTGAVVTALGLKSLAKVLDCLWIILVQDDLRFALHFSSMKNQH